MRVRMSAMTACILAVCPPQFDFLLAESNLCHELFYDDIFPLDNPLMTVLYLNQVLL